MNLNDIISASILIMIGYPIIQYLVTHEEKYIFMLVGLIFTDIITKIFKHTTREIPMFSRPNGACDCDLLSKNGSQENKPGFPSGHMATTAFFAIYLLFQGGISPFKNPILLTASLFFVSLMGYVRYVKKCHSIVQIVAGTFLGGAMGAIFSLKM